MSGFAAILARDVRLAFRQGGAAALTVAFFLLTVTLFPLGVGPDLVTLSRISAGVLLVAALFSSMLSLDRLFQADFEDGSLELIALSPHSLYLSALAKCTAHWLTTGLPLVVVSPVLAVLLNMEPRAIPVLLLAMLLATPILSLIGGIGAGLTVGVRRGGVLLPILVLPLFIPALIFAVGAIEASAVGLSPRAHLLFLGAMLSGAAVLGPWASAVAVRMAME